MYRRPYLAVSGPEGEDMLKSWGSRLIGVKLVDKDGEESDEAHFIFTRKKPYMPIPGEGARFTVRLGWSERNAAVTGSYTFQRVHLQGHPKQGQQMTFICRAGDFIEHLKGVDSEHFDDKTGHKTLGDVFTSLFNGTGSPVVVDPEIAKRAIPGGYLLRWNQSRIDFGSELAKDNGAIIKEMDGRIIVLRPGSGNSATGADLPTLTIRFEDTYEYDFELEPRFQYQKVSASYLDTDKGTLEREDKDKGDKGARDALPHPSQSKDAAKALADAASAEWGKFTISGLFTIPGEPSAVATAPVNLTGFGAPIDGSECAAKAVTHDVVPNVGWTTTIELEAKADS